jgi:hypothetical protein
MLPWKLVYFYRRPAHFEIKKLAYFHGWPFFFKYQKEFQQAFMLPWNLSIFTGDLPIFK